MELVTQPPGSTLCGQACVAMLAGVTLKASCKAFGHKCATTLYAARRALKKLGFVAAEKYESFGRKQKRLPRTCLLRLKWPKQKLGHCVVFHKGQVYDPAGYTLDWSEFLQMNCDASLTYLALNPA